MEIRRVLQFEIIINVLDSSFRLIWIFMLGDYYGHYNFFNSLSVGSIMNVKIWRSVYIDVRFWRRSRSPRWKG